MGKNILTNRNLVAINKYAPTRTSDVKQFLIWNYRSVINVEFFDTTSSAGDWGGLLVQDIVGGKCYAIQFTMENRYPDDGFNIYTGNDYIIIDEKKKFDVEYLLSVWKDLINLPAWEDM
jgi:hypothetical protein